MTVSSWSCDQHTSHIIQSVGVSSLLGFGVEEFFKLVDESRQEYIR